MRRLASGRLAAPRKTGIAAGTVLCGVLLASCSGGRLDPVTKQGNGLGTLYSIMFLIALVIFVGVELAIWVFPIVFRRRRGDDELPKQIHGNNVLELVWVVIPAIIVVVLFTLSYRQITKVQAKEAIPNRTIKVIGKQWAWTFDYGNGVQVVGENATKDSAGFANLPTPPTLVVPVGETIEFQLQSNDVIHSFYIPQTLYKLDVVPGQQNSFQVQFDKLSAGQKGNGIYNDDVFPAACAELCGAQHAQMLFQVQVVSTDQFDRWVIERKAAAKST